MSPSKLAKVTAHPSLRLGEKPCGIVNLVNFRPPIVTANIREHSTDF
jgi:hypothetical protein